jgi:hypothetical protein
MLARGLFVKPRYNSFFKIAFGALLLTFGTVAAQAEDFPSEAAQKKGATRLQPVSPWTIDFAENKCRLSRLFGNADKPHLLMFEQAAPIGSFGMTLAGPELRRFRRGAWMHIGIKEDVPMQFLSDEFYGSIDHIGPTIIMNSANVLPRKNEDAPSEGAIFAGLDLQEAAKIQRVVLKVGSTVLSFETESMSPPFQALNVCTSDLLISWGLNPKQHTSYQPPRWINSKAIIERIQTSHPRAAMRRIEQAILRMRVVVESDGTVSDCHMENVTETEELEASACEEMQQVVFEPALDTKGAPMRSFYASNIGQVFN